jgi:outer membrane protein assembly factor BamB
MKTNQLSLLFLLLFTVVFNTQSQDLAQWRGINRDGIYKDKDLLKMWAPNGPTLIWSTDQVGSGFSSPVVSDNLLYINGEINRVAHLFAFGLDGKLQWKYANGPEFFGEGYSANFPGARSAPTVYSGLVYICSGMGRIACLDALSGEEKWTVNMVSDLGGIINMFGYSESLLVDENKVYCYPGGKETNVVALDRLTGKVIWKSQAKGDGVSFCSPMMIKLPERTGTKQVRNIETGELLSKTVKYAPLNILVTTSKEYLLGINAETGELLWSHKEDSVKLEGEHCNTPIYADGAIYCISGDDKGNGAYKLQLSPDGKSIEEVWRNGKVLNALGGFVKIGNRIYTSSKDNKLKVLDTETGQVTESLSGMKGNLVAADDLLFFYTDNGYINLIKGIGTKLEVVSKFKITQGTKEHFSHPVIANGVLYVRHGNALMAYGIK